MIVCRRFTENLLTGNSWKHLLAAAPGNADKNTSKQDAPAFEAAGALFPRLIRISTRAALRCFFWHRESTLRWTQTLLFPLSHSNRMTFYARSPDIFYLSGEMMQPPAASAGTRCTCLLAEREINDEGLLQLQQRDGQARHFFFSPLPEGGALCCYL